MQRSPPRHRDVNVGNFFLAEKEGGWGFTSAGLEAPSRKRAEDAASP
jgi:hypothetical protein